MSFRRLSVAILMLAATACVQPPADPPAESTADQTIGVSPNCSPGGTLIMWEEETGVCGQCTSAGDPGTPERQFAACTDDIQRTKRLIRTLCATPCPP